MAEGRTIVVDMDLEKFFDRVNHDILMARLARRVGDKRLLRIIRRFLEAGLMQDGVCVARHEGTPQGGPLSPLLGEPAFGRPGQGTGTTGPPLLPLCRRLQHLRAVESGGRTGAGVGDSVPGRVLAAARQPGEKCGGVTSRNASSSAIVSCGAASWALPPRAWSVPRIASGRSPVAIEGSSIERMIGELNSVPDGLGDVLPPCEVPRAILTRVGRVGFVASCGACG